MPGGRGEPPLKRALRINGWIIFVVVAMLFAYEGRGSRAWSETTSGLDIAQAKTTPAQCSAGNLFTFENHDSYPIWLGEFFADPTKVIVPQSGWKIEPAQSRPACAPRRHSRALVSGRALNATSKTFIRAGP